MIVGCFSATRRGKPRPCYSATIKDASCWTRTPETKPTMVAHAVLWPRTLSDPLGHKPSSRCPRPPSGLSPDRHRPEGQRRISSTTFVVSFARRAALSFETGRFSTRKILISHLTQAQTGGGERDRTDDLMLAKHALSQLSYAPGTRSPPSPQTRKEAMVGQGGLEPPTSRLSSARSNQLSYKPKELIPTEVLNDRPKHSRAPRFRVARR